MMRDNNSRDKHRKIWIAILAAMLIASLGACGGNKKGEVVASSSEEAEAVEEGEMSGTDAEESDANSDDINSATSNYDDRTLDDDSNIKTGRKGEKPDYINDIEKAYVKEMARELDSKTHTWNLVEKIGSLGYTVVDAENRVDMINASELQSLIDNQKKKSEASTRIVQVLYDGGLLIYDIHTADGSVDANENYYMFDGAHLNGPVINDFKADTFTYTDDGYLFISGKYTTDEQLALSGSNEEVHVALRIKPLDEKCRQLCEAYMIPISYRQNNMFISDWNKGNHRQLDFYDLFEKFYPEVYNNEFPYVMNDKLTVKNEYEVPASEFETVVMQHIPIRDIELRKIISYDEKKDCYKYIPRSFDEMDYAQIPYPEVVSYEKNKDGSITMEVNAVYPNDDTSKLFSHKVTVLEIAGLPFYVSNEMVGKKPDLWWHADRTQN